MLKDKDKWEQICWKKKNNYQHQLIAMLDPVKIKEFLDVWNVKYLFIMHIANVQSNQN